jgi:hypothetical protein
VQQGMSFKERRKLKSAARRNAHYAGKKQDIRIQNNEVRSTIRTACVHVLDTLNFILLIIHWDWDIVLFRLC